MVVLLALLEHHEINEYDCTKEQDFVNWGEPGGVVAVDFKVVAFGESLQGAAAREAILDVADFGASGRVEDVANPLFANAIGTALTSLRNKLKPELFCSVSNVPPAAETNIQPAIENVDDLAHKLVRSIKDFEVLRVDGAACTVQCAFKLVSEPKNRDILGIGDVDFELAHWAAKDAVAALASLFHVEKRGQLPDNIILIGDVESWRLCHHTVSVAHFAARQHLAPIDFFA